MVLTAVGMARIINPFLATATAGTRSFRLFLAAAASRFLKHKKSRHPGPSFFVGGEGVREPKKKGASKQKSFAAEN